MLKNCKRILMGLAVLVLVFAMLPFQSQAAESGTYKGLTATFSGSTYKTSELFTFNESDNLINRHFFTPLSQIRHRQSRP